MLILSLGVDQSFVRDLRSTRVGIDDQNLELCQNTEPWCTRILRRLNHFVGVSDDTQGIVLVTGRRSTRLDWHSG